MKNGLYALETSDGRQIDPGTPGRISRDTLDQLGHRRVENARELSARLFEAAQSRLASNSGRQSASQSVELAPQSGQPTVLNARSALSAALAVNIGGRDTQFSEVALVADWDGREDCAADREQKIDDFSTLETDIDTVQTDVAISEHTVANGFAENVYYYGDSLGNLWVGTDIVPGINVSPAAAIDVLRQINIPTLINTGASGGFVIANASGLALGCTDDQVVVTGIAVQPVADLSDFPTVACGTIGEVVYVSVQDSEGCSSNAQGQVVRSRILAFPFVDGVGAGAATPAGTTPTALQIYASSLSNVAGLTVDDDGSLYFHQVDLIQFGGGAVFKATERLHVSPACGAANPRINRVILGIPTATSAAGVTSIGAAVGSAANPILISATVTLTNYTGPSLTFGNMVAIDAGPCNVIYAALSGSLGAGGVVDTSQGLFPAPAQFTIPGGTTGLPSLVISFADCAGSTDFCTVPAGRSDSLPGQIETGDGFADISPGGPAGSALTFGVNNFRVFVLGNGPDIRPAANATPSVLTAIATSTTLRITDGVGFQVDFQQQAGLAVNEEGTVFVISGGGSGGPGKNPSAMFSEILCFEDMCPMDRRADFVDLRGDILPNPPASGLPNQGDGDSDRFDHIFYQAPIDAITLTPTGLSGLATGFLRYTNRLAPSPIGPGVALGQTIRVLGDDSTTDPLPADLTNDTGTVVFEFLDPGHQVAGGDDQNTPFTGDDSDTVVVPAGFIVPPFNVLTDTYPAGRPAVPGLQSGGFEFVFGADTSSITGVLGASLASTAGPPSGTTTITVVFASAGAAAAFPISGCLTIGPNSAGQREVVRFVRDPITQAGATRTLTVIREQFGTPARSFAGGEAVVFGNAVSGLAGCCDRVWNGFFWNSNGNITFGNGDPDGTPSVPELRANDPRIAPAWADLNPNARAVDLGTFPVLALGFANVNSFKIRWINVPEFGLEGCTGVQDPLVTGLLTSGGGATNTFAVTLFDDGTGLDENTTERRSPAAVVGNNLDDGAALFNQQEGPTDLRFTREATTNALVGCPPRVPGSGNFLFEYCRMDLIGIGDPALSQTFPFSRPVIVGYSVGFSDPLNPPGLCEINLSEAARAADTAPFGVIQGTTASIVPCLIGEGTEPHLFELFNEGSDPVIGSGGEVTFATPDFDLRFEGNDAAACTPVRQRDLNRGKVGFFGVSCPANPTCQAVFAIGLLTPPGVAGQPGAGNNLVDAICNVQLAIVGCGFFPNEQTIVCQGFNSQTGIPLQRPGKTVSTSLALACDTNGDGIPEAVVPLSTTGTGPAPGNLANGPISRILVRGTLLPLATLPGTAFPAACCGGAAAITVTTTFTAGDNNIFGPFTRTAVCAVDLGVRAPIVFSVTPSDGNCAVPQDLLISGACFLVPQGAVTSVFAVERGNPSNVIPASAFQVLNNNLIDAIFNFGSANAGKTFLIFVVGPGGTSRNLLTGIQTPPAGTNAAAACQVGNEQGIQVTFTCNATTTPQPPPNGGADVAVVTNCVLQRSSTGTFTLDVIGTNIRQGATVTIGGNAPRKVKFRDLQTGSNTFNRLVLKGRVCSNLPGAIVITNPGARASAPFQCNARCPSN
jgi:hypothetical protein